MIYDYDLSAFGRARVFKMTRRLDVNVNAGLEVRQSGKADDPLAHHADLEPRFGNWKARLHLGSALQFGLQSPKHKTDIAVQFFQHITYASGTPCPRTRFYPCKSRRDFTGHTSIQRERERHSVSVHDMLDTTDGLGRNGNGCNRTLLVNKHLSL